MLLFINARFLSHEKNTDFNTSHVTVYQMPTYFSFGKIGISIHLMLLFIFPVASAIFPTSTISIHLMLLFIRYRKRITDHLPEFQYISCYCLSPVPKPVDESWKGFQYISCYCLSRNFFNFFI